MRIPSRLFLLIAACSTVWGTTITIQDPFGVNGNSDVIGNPLDFDAQSVQVTYGSGKLTLDIFTNFQNPYLYAFVDTGVRLDIGDVFFTVNGNIEYGIPLEYHNGPAGGPFGDRLYAGHVYQIDEPSALMTAAEVLHHPQYVDYRPDTIVWMMDQVGGVTDVTVGTPSVKVLPIAGDNGVNGPLYDIRVQTSLPAGLFSSPTDTYGLQWSVATCGNDIVQGTLNVPLPSSPNGMAPVPEPGTAYLVIGGVLIGVSWLVKQRR